MARYPLAPLHDLEPGQQMDLARRRWQAETALATALDAAESERRAADHQARIDYQDACDEAQSAHRATLIEIEALELEARLEAAQLPPEGR